MAIYQLKTFDDIVDAALEELKIQSTDTVSINRIKRDINIVYMQEVVPYDHWQWLRGSIDLVHKAYINTGTATITNGSVSVTLSSAPSTSKKGFYFSVQGSLEIYKIAEHTAASTTLILETPITQASASAQNYRIWTDKLPLPIDCRETVNVRHDFSTVPVCSVGLQAFREQYTAFPKSERRPEYCTTADYVAPIEYITIPTLPALSTRASSTLVKTLVFAASITGLVREGDFIEITNAGHYSYNGKFQVASVSTNTMTYTGSVPYQEAATADLSLTLKLRSTDTDAERYRELWVYPSLYNADVLMHVDYIKEIKPLENDTDEPLMPIEDRSVLLFGALVRAWTRHGDPDEVARNATLYDRKLMKMLGKLNDSTDYPQLKVSSSYMRSKRTSPRLSSLYKWWKF